MRARLGGMLFLIFAGCGLQVTGTATTDAGPQPVTPESGPPLVLPTQDAGGTDSRDAGARAPDASLPDAPLPDAGPDTGTPPLSAQAVVFVSSDRLNGNLGGIAGANAHCNQLAGASTNIRIKGRTFRAWLADGTDSPATSTTWRKTGPFVRPDGTTVIANDWPDLVNGGIRVPINTDDKGGIWNQNDENDDVWTGVAVDGTKNTSDCSNWTSSSTGGNGNVGFTTHDDAGWTAADARACNVMRRIYCFEQ